MAERFNFKNRNGGGDKAPSSPSKESNITPVNEKDVGANRQEEARTFLKDNGITTREGVNKYVEKNFGGDATKFFESFNKPKDVKGTIADAQDTNIKTGEDLAEINQKQIEQNEAKKDADLKRGEEFAQQNEELIKSTEEEEKALDDEVRLRNEETAKEEIRILKEKEKNALITANADKEKLEADAEYNRIQNENAIIDAKAQVEVERQQSAWAYHRLGLGFSSGIINQSQQIATQGIQKIAEIRAKMNLNEAILGVEKVKVTAKLKDIELQYTTLVNEAISTYSDKLDTLDRNTLKRLTQVKAQLLTNRQQQRAEEDKITNSYLEEQNKLEKEHIQDIQGVQDRGLELAKEMQATIQQEQNLAQTKIDRSIKTGAWFSMSRLERDKLLLEGGLSSLEGKAFEKKVIGDEILTKSQSLMPKDFVLDGDLKLELRNEVTDLLDSGYTLDEATDIATAKILKNTTEFKRAEELKNLKFKADKIALNKKINPPSATGRGKPTKTFVDYPNPDYDENLPKGIISNPNYNPNKPESRNNKKTINNDRVIKGAYIYSYNDGSQELITDTSGNFITKNSKGIDNSDTELFESIK